MAKAKKEPKMPPRVKLSPEESLKRVEDFANRKEAFIAAVRKGKNRDIPA